MRRRLMIHSRRHQTMTAATAWIAIAMFAPNIRAQNAQRPGVQAVAAPCESDVNRRRFDFWIGEWNVETRAGQPAGKSSVQRVSGGCGLLENWTAPNGSTGKSLNTYNPELGQWQQFWVGQFGAVTEYRESEWHGDTLVFHATSHPNAGTEQLLRLSFTPLPGGSVRQFGEASKDHGKT